MKLKSFINSQAKVVTGEVIKKTVQTTDKPVSRLRRWTEAHPVASLTIMFSIVIANIGSLYFFTNTFSPVAFNVKNIGQHITDSTGQINDMGVPFNFENYREMLSIRDTLEYLGKKKPRSAADSAIALRLLERMEKLDPQFFNKIKKLKNEKDKF